MSSSATPLEPDVVTKRSPRSVIDTVSRFTEMVNARSMKVFAVIDQSAEARQAGLHLRDTTLVIFGSPVAGTPVMEESPLAALDLPLKVLIWADEEGTKVTYYSSASIGARHHLRGELVEKLAGIDHLTDALVDPQ